MVSGHESGPKKVPSAVSGKRSFSAHAAKAPRGPECGSVIGFLGRACLHVGQRGRINAARLEVVPGPQATLSENEEL